MLVFRGGPVFAVSGTLPWLRRWGRVRRWRTLDVGSIKAYLQAPAPRVSCREHGMVVAHVPWARPGAKCGYVFEDTCAWLAAHTTPSVVAVFLRLAWRTVADIVTPVVADGRETNDLLTGLARIGSTRSPTARGIGS